MAVAVQSFRWFHVFITVFTGLSTFTLYAVIILSLALQSLMTSQSSMLGGLIAESEKIAFEGRSVLTRMNALGFDHCSDELLDVMRQELFLASRIRDIGFIRGNTLLCTTGQGILETPLEQDPWDSISKDGFKYWLAARLVLFDGDITAPVVGKDQFNVVFDGRWLKQQALANARWELVYRTSLSQTQHTYGDLGVFRDLKGESNQTVSPASTYSETCSDTSPYCASTELRHVDVTMGHPWFAAFLVLIGLVLGCGSASITWLILKRRLSTENRIIRGLKQNAYFPLYQPIVNLEDGKIVGCEVLARFQDAYGELCPSEFIPVLAKASLGWSFTQVIIQKTLDELTPSTGLPEGFKVNINLFPSDIAQNRVKNADISLALAASRFHIAFEITEDEQLDTAAAKDCLEWIKHQGFDLAVDDFGTGYSNLSKVRDLGCNTLKIDRSFVFDIDAGGLGAALVPLMIRIADELNMEVVAEGVETNTQATIVRDMGVKFGQGWAFGKPMLAQELERHILEPMPVIQ